MTRIATFGSNQMYINRVMNIQQRLHDLNVQVATEKKAPNYSGIARDANRLINFENERSNIDQYLSNNTLATTKMKAADNSIDAVRRTMKEFSNRLDEFITNTTTDQQHIEAMQEWAFRGLIEMQAYLGVTVDGNYIFSGGRVNTNPVDLPTSSITAFQAVYDGENHTYPTSRDAHLFDFSATVSTTFNAGTDSMTGPSASLANVPVGARITITGGANDGQTFTVTAVNTAAPNTTLTLSPPGTVVNQGATNVTVSASSWYKGDTLTLEQRIDRDRTIDVGIYASDPAFEKAIRAMGLIAQGTFGTNGGLENNLNRLQEAKFLINDALKSPAGNNPLGTTELQSDLNTLESRLGVNLSVLHYQDQKHVTYKSLLETRIIQMENVDKTEAIAKLLDDQRALEAAYQAMSKVRQMSLLQFM